MARIRSIKPEFWSDAKIVTLAFEHRLLFQGLWNFADDAGFIENRPDQIKINVFPADDVDIAEGIRALKRSKLIEVVRLDGKSVIHVLNWKHQRIDKPQPSRFVALYDEYQARCPIPGTFQEHSENVPAGGERKGEDRKGKEDTQVGSGGYLGSDAISPPPPPFEPWRCKDHQGVDAKCFSCKAAKDDYKAGEAQRKADAARAKADAEKRRLKAERDARADGEEPADPETIARLKAQALAKGKVAS